MEFKEKDRYLAIDVIMQEFKTVNAAFITAKVYLMFNINLTIMEVNSYISNKKKAVFEEEEICEKCMGSGELISSKRTLRVRVCDLCHGKGVTPTSVNHDFINTLKIFDK